MYRFIAAIAIVATGCSSDPGSPGGQGTTAVDADAVMIEMSHEDVAITVYKTKQFVIGDASDCKGFRGDLTDAEMSALQGYIGDAALQTLGMECSEDSYRLAIGVRPSVCWPADKKSPGLDGLIKFYEGKVEQLASAPAGKCGANQNVEPSNWPKKGAAGQGN